MPKILENNFGLQTLQNYYQQFLNHFPTALHPLISLILAGLIVYLVIQIIRKDFIYLIALVVLLPASIPILRNILESLASLLKFLF